MASRSSKRRKPDSSQSGQSSGRQPNIIYYVTYESKQKAVYLHYPVSAGYFMKYCRDYVFSEIPNHVALRLCDETGATIPDMTVLEPDAEVDLERVEQQDLNLAKNILLDNFHRICSRRYERNIRISRPDAQKRQTIDIRRAYSLIQWRCIYKVVAEMHVSDLDPSIRQSLLDEVFQPRDDDVDVSLEEVLASTLRDKLDRRHRPLASESDEQDDDIYVVPIASCILHCRRFRFSSNARCEIQFQRLWEGILSATIGLENDNFPLYPGYLMGMIVPDSNIELKASQLVDFLLFYENCKNPFVALFVEIAGSSIHPEDDHKDFKK